MKINKKLILGTVPYVFIFIIALQVIPQIPLEMPMNDILIAFLATAVIRIVVYVKGKNAKKYRKGCEYGSARWGNEKDIQPYIDPDFKNNVLLSQTERLTMNSRPKNPAHARNKNVLVIGGSGSGTISDLKAILSGGKTPKTTITTAEKPITTRKEITENEEEII